MINKIGFTSRIPVKKVEEPVVKASMNLAGTVNEKLVGNCDLLKKFLHTDFKVVVEPEVSKFEMMLAEESYSVSHGQKLNILAV